MLLLEKILRRDSTVFLQHDRNANPEPSKTQATNIRQLADVMRHVKTESTWLISSNLFEIA